MCCSSGRQRQTIEVSTVGTLLQGRSSELLYRDLRWSTLRMVVVIVAGMVWRECVFESVVLSKGKASGFSSDLTCYFSMIRMMTRRVRVSMVTSTSLVGPPQDLGPLEVGRSYSRPTRSNSSTMSVNANNVVSKVLVCFFLTSRGEKRFRYVRVRSCASFAQINWCLACETDLRPQNKSHR